MPFDQQQSARKSARVTVQFPALPTTQDSAQWDRWYFQLRTSVQDALNALAGEIDQLKAKD